MSEHAKSKARVSGFRLPLKFHQKRVKRIISTLLVVVCLRCKYLEQPSLAPRSLPSSAFQRPADSSGNCSTPPRHIDRIVKAHANNRHAKLREMGRWYPAYDDD
jgi:hypothetical protein